VGTLRLCALETIGNGKLLFERIDYTTQVEINENVEISCLSFPSMNACFGGRSMCSLLFTKYMESSGQDIL